MARFLLTVWPFPTHLHPYLAVADALMEAGHQAAFYTDGSVAQVVRGEGFEIFPYQRLNWPHIQQTVERLIAARGRFDQRELWRDFLVGQIPDQLADLEAILVDWRPDVIVCDVSFWGPMLFLREQKGIPVAALAHVANCLLPGPQRPIPGVALPRNHSRWARLKARLISVPVRLASRNIPRAADKLRRERGLPPLGMSATEYTGQMDAYLVPSTPEFDHQREDLPPSVHYVGPCLWHKPAGQPAADWIARVPRNGRPVVVVEEGGLFTREAPALASAMTGLAGLPYEVVVLTGNGRAPGTPALPSIAANVQVHPWTPLGDVLPLAQVMVTNGNSDSVIAALMCGLPLVVSPSIWDQNEIALRVEELGAGLRIPARACSPNRLREAVETVVQTAKFRNNALRLGKALAGRGGPKQAAQLLESLVPRS